MEIQPTRGFCFFFCLALAFLSQVPPAPAQTAERDSALSPQEAAKRQQFLKATASSDTAPASPAATPARKHFAETRNPEVRLNDPSSPQASRADTHKSETAPAKETSSPASKTARKKKHSPDVSTSSGKSTEKTAKHKHHEESVASAKHHSESPATETPSAKSKASTAHAESVTEAKRSSETRVAENHPAASPAPKSGSSGKHAEVVVPMSKRGDVEIAGTSAAETTLSRSTLPPAHVAMKAGRYPWKTGIVTTVFWIGEPVGGNNFTPNCSSSWDAHWTQSYGGFDNPNPEARRNFLPVNFTPRQNPFYVALPYNDVTRGTTKPEARAVIPWFHEAYRKEGQSVCRDRWVEIRGRSGRVAYAQWSDCGPFRTDHWQYVFGMDRPKPNLNGGAGLDVSPAVRDYLGLQPTDVTDWKFVDTHEVPNGPWLLYGDNNPFAQRHSHGAGFGEVIANRR